MTPARYRFITRWRMPSTCEAVYDLLSKPELLTEWWPSVYLEVEVLEEGAPGGLGKRVRLLTRGRLPYTLLWEFVTTRVDRPSGFTLEASGDFVGRGIWEFEQEGDAVLIRFDWQVEARKPLLRYFSFLMKPLFAANHRWAMAQGEASLRTELEARRAVNGQRSRHPSHRE